MKKVLIVDDDSDMRMYYRSVLEELAIEFAEAENGEIGLKKLKEARPDLILLDIMMPKKSGLLVFHEIQTNPECKDIPVIIISGVSKATGFDMKYYLFSEIYKTKKEKMTGKEWSAPVNYLEKPVKPKDLLEAVVKVLGF